ncbi:hypothetical protein D3C85_768840 [compost metagenome]
MQPLSPGQVALPLQSELGEFLLQGHQLLVVGASGLLQLGQLTLQLGEPLMAGQLLRLQVALLRQQGRDVLHRLGVRPLELGQFQPEPGQLLLAQGDELRQILLRQLPALAACLLLLPARTRLLQRPLGTGDPLLGQQERLRQRLPLLLQFGKLRLFQLELLLDRSQPLGLLGLLLVQPGKLFPKLAEAQQPLLTLTLLQAPGFPQLLPLPLLLAQGALARLKGAVQMGAVGICGLQLGIQLNQGLLPSGQFGV